MRSVDETEDNGNFLTNFFHSLLPSYRAQYVNNAPIEFVRDDYVANVVIIEPLPDDDIANFVFLEDLSEDGVNIAPAQPSLSPTINRNAERELQNYIDIEGE